VKQLIVIPIFILISNFAMAKGKVYSLGAGTWSVADSSTKLGSNSSLSSFSDGKFARLTHEGLIGSNFLYVIGVGANLSDAKSEYSFKGINTTTTLNELEAKISLVEAKLGLKYQVFEWLYLGAGGLIGDFQINYDRTDYINKVEILKIIKNQKIQTI